MNGLAVSYSVEMNGIVKRFGRVLANDHATFAARPGEIHALLGENGAGKSTLMSILSGLYRPEAGEIRLYGRPVPLQSPKDASALGIGMVYQNFRLVPTLTAVENLVLGERGFRWLGRSWRREKEEEIGGLLDQFGLYFPADRPIWQLSLGEQQRVEIVKVLYRGADIIVLDEPTSVLTPREAADLFRALHQMKAAGKTVILTTHKLKEVMAWADRITVMRKGRTVRTMETRETDEKELARLMVGRDVMLAGAAPRTAPGEVLLRVRDVEVIGEHGRPALQGLNLEVRRGEIVGVAGVAGNGQRELAECLTGLRPWNRGTVEFEGESLSPRLSAKDMITRGIGHIPEDRMKTGLAGKLSVLDNLLLKSYRSRECSPCGLLFLRRWERRMEGLIHQFDVKTPSLHTAVQQLSGGNQQKLLFAREIEQHPHLLIAVHPAQGLDVGVTEAVYRILMDLRNEGTGILLISEDLDEVMHLSDRILMMCAGRIKGEFTRDRSDRETIGLLMAGVSPGEEAAV
ncbi:MAG: ABC transporter ATP-binding protein [Kyrpidia sp.]|nr:ABC transporter ATP-binding protein [Kyrpidia sp.]